jgi:hypothetical protein
MADDIVMPQEPPPAALPYSPTYSAVPWALPGIQQLGLCQLLRSGIAHDLCGYKRYSFHS